MSDEDDYLEMRKYTCPKCKASYTFVIYRRPPEGTIVDCGCGVLGIWDWKEEKFTKASDNNGTIEIPASAFKMLE